MRIKFKMPAAMLLLGIFAGCEGSYDFRSGDRPIYRDMITADRLIALQDEGAIVLDVRLLEDFDSDPVLIPNSVYRDPDKIEAWVGQMSPKDGAVVVYCVHGKWVSQKAANYLEEQGFEVYALDGGIADWKLAGHMTSSLGETDGVSL